MVWLAAAVGALLIGLLAIDDSYIEWIAMDLGACVIVTLCIQLAIRRPQGFLARVTASMVGVVVVLAVATLVLLAVASIG